VTGLSGSDQGGLKHWYDQVAYHREKKLTRPLNVMDQIAARDFGVEVPEWEYCNLFQLSDLEIAQLQEVKARRDASYHMMRLPGVEEQIMTNLRNEGVYLFEAGDIATAGFISESENDESPI